MKSLIFIFILFSFLIASQSCKREEILPIDNNKEWKRAAGGPVFRDTIDTENYQAASDAHVFFDSDKLRMIYSGDYKGNISIKLAKGISWSVWQKDTVLLGNVGPSGLDINKETPFYRRSLNGKHQIYYIGYDNEETYEAQIYLAEADFIKGPYTQMLRPVISRGIIAGENVYAMTSPSVVEHQGMLYITFIGWDNKPDSVTKVWIIGAKSYDDGHSWTDFKKVDTKIGMEGQITKIDENEFVAVRTGEYENKQAIFYSTASHPFGPWDELDNPILIQAGPPYEKDELIAPQITLDIVNGNQILYYTGADYSTGWWIMMATEK